MIVFRWKSLFFRKRLKLLFFSSSLLLLLLFLFFARKSFRSNSVDEKLIGQSSKSMEIEFLPPPGLPPIGLPPIGLHLASSSADRDDDDDDYEVFTFSVSSSRGVTELPRTQQEPSSPPPPSPPPLPRGKIFSYQMTGREKSVVYMILDALETSIARYGIRYYLCGGTLLGSYRHHDLIPWDDDVDVCVNRTERDDVYAVLSALSPAYTVFSTEYRLKLYSQHSTRSSRFEWRFPYVDINFFEENATHVYDADPVFRSQSYPKDKIFPLHRRPLGALMPFAPRDTLFYLKNTYRELGYCVTTPYDHRLERSLGAEAVYYTRCRSLRHRFPFVYRSFDGRTKQVRETLRVGETELHTVVVDEEPPESVGDPFKLEKSDRGKRTRRTDSRRRQRQQLR